LIFAAVAKGLTGWGGTYGESRFGFGYDPDEFAFEAADFLKSAAVEGHVLNLTLAQGDALIWRAYPDRKTFNDGRSHLFPPAVANRLQELRNALRDDDSAKWKPILDDYKVSVVMVQPAATPIIHSVLLKSPNWVAFHDDGNVVLFGRADASEKDLAFFKANRLDPQLQAFSVDRATPPPEGPPTPVGWMDQVFQARLLARAQPHNDSGRRWLLGPDFDPNNQTLPEPARCLMAIREARTALASKPDDTQAYRLLADAYRLLMIQEGALLSGLKLTPEDAVKVAQTNPRPDLLSTRFRQRVTALNYAIQSTPQPKTAAARADLQRLNNELFNLHLSVNHLDLARDRLAALKAESVPTDFSDEGRVLLSQQFAQLEEKVKQVEENMTKLATDQQAGPYELAQYAVSQGCPGLAIRELKEAERSSTNPALVKPKLLDLYCETGQPEMALEMLGAGAIEDPQFGAEPGTSALRQGRAYFLIGNAEYAATLWEKYAIPRLRYDRTVRALGETQALVKGEAQSAVNSITTIPDGITQQAVWEYETGLARLEAGTPSMAAEHFSKALELAPKLVYRPVIAYYLEKLGKPVPAEPEASTEPPAAPAASPLPSLIVPPGVSPPVAPPDGGAEARKGSSADR
jgi:tetratricopeptide (TPR) repeat protein